MCCLGSIEDKFRAFGYHVVSVQNGNDTGQIYQAIQEAKAVKDKPSVILLHTVKGAGIRYYEEMANCHSTEVKKENLPDFYQELDRRLKEKEEA